MMPFALPRGPYQEVNDAWSCLSCSFAVRGSAAIIAFAVCVEAVATVNYHCCSYMLSLLLSLLLLLLLLLLLFALPLLPLFVDALL